MRITIFGLFLSSAVLLSFIELSSQSESNPYDTRRNLSPPRKIAHGESSTPINRPRRMHLPHPYYYDLNGNIRSRDFPEAHPIMDMDKSFFFGMAKGEHFFPVIERGQYKIFNLKENVIISLSQDEFEKILSKTIFPNGSLSPRSPKSSPYRTSPGPSTNLQLRPPGQN